MRLSILRNLNGDGAILVDLYVTLAQFLLLAVLSGVRRLLVAIELVLGACGFLSRVLRRLTVLVSFLELRLLNLDVLARLTRFRPVFRHKLVSVTVGRLNDEDGGTSCGRAVLVGHLNRNLNAVLVGSIRRESHGNLAGLRINLDGILSEALRSLKALRQLELRRFLGSVLVLQLFSAELLNVIGLRVIESRSLGLLFLARLSLGLLVMWLPTDQHRERISSDSLTTCLGLLVDWVQVRGKRRRGLNTGGIQLAGRNGAAWLRIHRITGLLNLAGLLVYPFNLVLQTINPLAWQASSLGLNLVAWLCRVLASVVVDHVKDNVVRVDDVAVFQQVRLASTVDKATCPLALTVEHVLATREEGIVVERRELTKTLSLLRGEEQPIPVHVLRQVLATTAGLVLYPAAVVSCRCNLTVQAVSVVLGTIREDHLSTVVTGQIGVTQGAIVVATVNITVGTTTAKGALELQRVVAIATDGCLGSLSDPLFLAFFGHLALDPVLQRSLIAVGPTTAADLLAP